MLHGFLSRTRLHCCGDAPLSFRPLVAHLLWNDAGELSPLPQRLLEVLLSVDWDAVLAVKSFNKHAGPVKRVLEAVGCGNLR